MKQFIAGVAVAVLGLGLFSPRSNPSYVISQPAPQISPAPVVSPQVGPVQPETGVAPVETVRGRPAVPADAQYPVVGNRRPAVAPDGTPAKQDETASPNQRDADEEYMFQRQNIQTMIMALPKHGKWGGYTVAPAEREGLTELPVNEAKWGKWRIENNLPMWTDSADHAYFLHDLRLIALNKRYPKLGAASRDIEVGFIHDQLARDLEKALEDESLSIMTRVKTKMAITVFRNAAKWYSVGTLPFLGIEDPGPARTKIYSELVDVFKQVRVEPDPNIAKPVPPGTVAAKPADPSAPAVNNPVTPKQNPDTKPQDSKVSAPDGAKVVFDNFAKWWTKMSPQELEKAKAADPEGWKKHMENGPTAEEFRMLQEALKAKNPEIFGKPESKSKPGTEPVAGKPLPDDMRKLLTGKNPKEAPSKPAQPIPQDRLLESVRTPQGTPAPANPIVRGSTPEDRVRIGYNDEQPQAPAPVYQNRPTTSQPVYQGPRTGNDQGGTRQPVGPGYGPGTGRTGPEGQRPITVHTVHQPNPNAVPTPVTSIRNNTPNPTLSTPPVTQTPSAPPINQRTNTPPSSNGTAPYTGPRFSFDDDAPKSRPGQTSPVTRTQNNAPPPGTEPVVRDTPRPNPNVNPVTQNPIANPTTLPNGQQPIQFTPIKPVDVAPPPVAQPTSKGNSPSQTTPSLKGVKIPLGVDEKTIRNDASGPSNLRDKLLKDK